MRLSIDIEESRVVLMAGPLHPSLGVPLQGSPTQTPGHRCPRTSPLYRAFAWDGQKVRMVRVAAPAAKSQEAAALSQS